MDMNAKVTLLALPVQKEASYIVLMSETYCFDCFKFNSLICLQLT